MELRQRGKTGRECTMCPFTNRATLSSSSGKLSQVVCYSVLTPHSKDQTLPSPTLIFGIHDFLRNRQSQYFLKEIYRKENPLFPDDETASFGCIFFASILLASSLAS